MLYQRLSAIFLLALFLVASGCGGGPGTKEITVRPVGDQMQYEMKEFTVQPGQQVRIIFENTASSPAMRHNVVVLNTNDPEVVNRVGQAALSAGESAGYIPADKAIIANTAMSDPGETVEVTFTAPEEPGDYTYICTFPGHFTTMQGTMHVVEG